MEIFWRLLNPYFFHLLKDHEFFFDYVHGFKCWKNTRLPDTKICFLICPFNLLPNWSPFDQFLRKVQISTSANKSIVSVHFFTFCTTQTQISSILNKKIQKLCKMKNKIWCRDQPCALISYAHKSTLNVWNEKRAQAVSELHKMGRVKMQVYIIREWNLNCKKYFLNVLTFKKINEEM